MAIYSSGQISSTYIEGITLGAGEEVDVVARGVRWVEYRVGEVGDRASEGQAAGVYKDRF